MYFTVRNFASLIDVTPRVVYMWCKNGSLCSIIKNGVIHISIENAIDFIYVNRKYQKALKNTRQECNWKELSEYILKAIEDRPRLYSIEDLMDIFKVKYSTVKTWVRERKIDSYKSRTTYRGRIFSEDSISSFVTKNEQYEWLFERYLESRQS